MSKRLSRRDMLAGVAGVGAAAVLGGCGQDRRAVSPEHGGRVDGPDFTTPNTKPKTRKTFEDTRIDPSTVVGREGFYRAGQDTEGRWWLLRPDGRPFIYKGVCAVCDGMPAMGGKPPNEYWKTWHGTYTGKDADRRFCLDSFRILDDMGFNAWGMWCFLRNPKSGYEDMGWPYVLYIHAREIYPKGTVGGNFTKTIDAFDPGWAKAYDAACRRRCTPHKDNPNLVGYYTDNEPFWGQPRLPKEMQKDKEHKNRPPVWGKDPLAGSTLLQNFLALPPERAGHEAAWSWVLKRHGGQLVDVAKAWGADFTSREDLRRRTEAKKLALDSVAYGRDHDDFTRLYADTYFRVTGEAIRRYDPNHMVLGMRHASHWTAYGEAALESYARNRRHVDVFSMNTYHYDMHEAVSGYAQFLDHPIIIGEASWGSWLDYKWGPPERYPDEIGWLRKEAVRQTARMMMHPAVIGYTWYKWYLGETPDRPAYGVVTDKGVVSRVNSAMLRRLNPVLEDVHAGTVAPEAI